jgi:FkbM family methyltransferase
MNRFVSYAQNFEDVILWRALKHIDRGFYVDCGAYDPTHDSVTKAFYDRGWRGINIEPISSLLQMFVVQRPLDANLAVAVSDISNRAEFYEIAGTGLSTLCQTIAQQHIKAGLNTRVTNVPTTTLSDILRQFAPSEIHFLKIDVEGAEDLVLRGAGFDRFRPWIVLVEATHPTTQQSSREAWEEILLNAEYDFAYFDGLNRFYVAKEHSELSKLIAVPPNVFDDFVLVDQIEAEQTLEALRFSTSWRLTAPLRKVKEVFRVLRDKIRQVVCYGITMEWFGTWTPGEPGSNLSSSRATGTPEGEVSATNARCSRTVIDDQNAEATAVRVPTRSRATSVDGRYRASSSAGPDRPLVALPAPQAVMGRRGRSRRG